MGESANTQRGGDETLIPRPIWPPRQPQAGAPLQALVVLVIAPRLALGACRDTASRSSELAGVSGGATAHGGLAVWPVLEHTLGLLQLRNHGVLIQLLAVQTVLVAVGACDDASSSKQHSVWWW